MNKTILATVGALALAVPLLAGAANALDTSAIDHCASQGNAATVFALPGAAEASTGFAPECVTVNAASSAAPSAPAGVVTFTNTDALFHIPHAAGCFDLGQINNGKSATISLKVINGALYTIGANGLPAQKCESQDQARSGSFIPKSEGPKFPDLQQNADGTFSVFYICAFHGPVMHGVINVVPS